MTDKRRSETISNALKRRVRKSSGTEKVFYGSITLTAITVAVSTIHLQSRDLQIQREITNLDGQVSDMQTDYDSAKQEASELTSRDRIKQIAGNAGLTSQWDNIKQVE